MSFSTVPFSLPTMCYLDGVPYKPLVDSESHVRLLHPPQEGTNQELVFLCSIDASLRFRQRPFKIHQLPEAVGSMQAATDVYFSQNRFSKTRQVKDCVALNSCFVDVDFYRDKEGGDSLELQRVVDECVVQLYLSRVPPPSIILFTGRGLLFVWLITPTSLSQLEKWRQVQRQLAKVLEGAKPDHNALDAARVFRLAGSKNSKSDKTVSGYALQKADRWTLDALAERVLPPPDQRQVARRPSASRGPISRLDSPRMSATTLWTLRYRDILRLIELRFGTHGLPPGRRDIYLFLLGVALAWMCPPESLEGELMQLAGQLGNWDEIECIQRFYSLMRWTIAAGEHRARCKYKYKTQTIVDQLEITRDEQLQLRVLVGEDLRRQGRRERAARSRRAKGGVSREDYQKQQTLEGMMKRVKIHYHMKVKKYSRKECALDLKMSAATVDKYLYRIKGPRPSLPVI